MRALLLRLHFYAGVLVGPFLLVAALSGGLYAIAPSVESIVYRSALHTDSTGTPHSLAEQVRAAQRDVPNLDVIGVRPPAKSGATTRVLFDDPTITDESTTRAVFVDPVTLKVTGNEANYGSSGSLPLRTWIDGLHRTLNLGETGRWYSELAASWLWVIALAGLVLWGSQIRAKRRSTGRGNPLLIDRTTKRRARSVNWHAALGSWIAIVLLFLSATGLTWSEYAGKHVSDLRSELSWTQPSTQTSLTGESTAGGGEHAGHGGSGDDMAGMDMGGMDMGAGSEGSVKTDTYVAETDAALTLAHSAGIGNDSAVEIDYPTEPGKAFTVTEVRDSWQFSPDAVAVDPATDKVVSVNKFADWPLAAKLANLGIALHMGILFGLANQIVLLVVAIVLVIVILRGYQMWWQRRRRDSRLPGRAPARGKLRELPVPAIIVIAVVAVAVGWFIPLLGWPLLGFLAIDIALGLFERWRNRADLEPIPPLSDNPDDGNALVGSSATEVTTR